MTLTDPNFALFDMNIQCLMRQEVQLLSESFKNGFSFLFIIIIIIIIINMPRYPFNKSPSFTQNIEKYSIRFIYHTSQIIC
jgi:hypothetical protein